MSFIKLPITFENEKKLTRSAIAPATANAMAYPSAVEVPRPSSSMMSKLFRDAPLSILLTKHDVILIARTKNKRNLRGDV